MTFYERLQERHVGWYTSPPSGAVLEKRGGEAGLAKASTMGLWAVRHAIKGALYANINLEGWWHDQPDWYSVRHPENGYGGLYRVMTVGVPSAGITVVRSALEEGYNALFDDTDIVHVFGVDRDTIDKYRGALSVVPEDAPVEPDRLWIPDHLKLEQ